MFSHRTLHIYVDRGLLIEKSLHKSVKHKNQKRIFYLVSGMEIQIQRGKGERR